LISDEDGICLDATGNLVAIGAPNLYSADNTDASGNGSAYLYRNQVYTLGVNEKLRVKGDIVVDDGVIDVSGDLSVSGNATINGNVGIGTDNPTAKLDVSGNVLIESSSQNPKLTLWSKNTGSYDPTIELIRNSATFGADTNYDWRIINNGGVFKLQTKGSNTGYTGQRTMIQINAVGGDFIIGDDSSKLVLDGSANISGNLSVDGNVGIGTTDPQANLDVSGTANFTGTVTTGNVLQVGTNTNDETPKTIFFGGTKDDNNYNLCVIENRVYSSSEKRELLLFSGNDFGGGTGPDRIRLKGGNILFDTYSTATDNRTTETTKMIIDIDGNVGIGTTNPKQKLEIHGNILLGKNDENSFIHGGYNSAFSSDGELIFVCDSNTTSGDAGSNIIFGSGSDANTHSNRAFSYSDAFPSNVPRNEHMRIKGSNGNVGIGTTNPQAKLDVDGSANITGDLNIQDGNLTIEHSSNTGDFDPYILLNSNKNNESHGGISSLFLTEQFFGSDKIQGAYMEYNGDSVSDNFFVIGTQNATVSGSNVLRVEALRINRESGNIISASAPTDDTHLTNKLYVDNKVDTKVSKSGDTMTGDLDISGNATINGNVGIGTTDPSEKLVVDGSANITGLLKLGDGTYEKDVLEIDYNGGRSFKLSTDSGGINFKSNTAAKTFKYRDRDNNVMFQIYNNTNQNNINYYSIVNCESNLTTNLFMATHDSDESLYPPMPMYSESVDEYSVSASSYFEDFYPYSAFDRISTTDWLSAYNKYNSSGDYTGSVQTVTTHGETPHTGEYIEINGRASCITRFQVRTSATRVNHTPKKITLVGKYNNNWIHLGSWDGLVHLGTDTNGHGQYYINSDVYHKSLLYNAYRIIVEKTNGVDHCAISEIKIITKQNNILVDNYGVITTKQMSVSNPIDNLNITDNLILNGEIGDKNDSDACGVGLMFRTIDDNSIGKSRISSLTSDGDFYGLNGSESNTSLLFETSNTGVLNKRMIITSDGNVGIGITDPTTKLEVDGDTRIYDALYIGKTGENAQRMISFNDGSNDSRFTIVMDNDLNTIISNTNPTSYMRFYNNQGDYKFDLNDGGNYTALTIKGSNGNVGIGTTDPQAKLHVSSGVGANGNCTFILEADIENNNENANPQMVFRQDGEHDEGGIGIDNDSNRLTISSGAHSDSGIVFKTSSTPGTDLGDNSIFKKTYERMRITDTGNVGIGTNNPSALLHTYSGSFGDNGFSAKFARHVIDGQYNGIGLGTAYQVMKSAIFQERYSTYISKLHLCHNSDNTSTNVSLDDAVLTIYNGNVGIGTTNPGAKLDVSGTANITGTVTTGNVLQVGTYTSGDTTSKTIFFGGTQGDSEYKNCVIENRIYSSGNEKHELLLFSGNDIGGSSGPDRIRLKGGNILFDTYSTGTDNRTAETTKMIIDIDGNVGIGTTVPSEKLEVNGNAIIGGDLTVNSSKDIYYKGDRLDNRFVSVAGDTMTGDLEVGGDLSVVGGDLSVDGFTQTVGLRINQSESNSDAIPAINGFTTTIEPYEIAAKSISGGDGFLRIRAGYHAGTNGTAANVSFIDLCGYKQTAANSNIIRFGTNAIERMRIDRNGNVGIGTTDPKSRLHIHENTGTVPGVMQGSLIITHGNSGGGSSIVFPSNVNDTSDYGYISYKDDYDGDGGENGTLTIGVENDEYTSTNNEYIVFKIGDITGMQIYGTSDTAVKVEIQGTCEATSFNATSDIRVKTNIETIEPNEALEQINKLEPKTYKFYDSEETHYGLVAQDAEKIIPESVKSTGTKMIPSIGETCKLINSGKTIVLDTKTTSDMVATKLEFDDISGNKQSVGIESFEGDKYIHLKSSIEEHAIKTSDGLTIYVHGHEVNDFRSINYNTIVAANVAATKALTRELNETRTELNETRTELNELKKLVEQLLNK